MKQFPFSTASFSNSDQNQENRSPLKLLSETNLLYLNKYKSSGDSLKDSQNFQDIEFVEKLLKTYEETISRQRLQIEKLKQEVKNGRQYATALEQKYTILLGSVQPFQEKVNLQILVNKIFEMENRAIFLQTTQNDPASLKLLKLNQKNTLISSEHFSKKFDLLQENSVKSVQQKSIKKNNELFNIILSKTDEYTNNQNSLKKSLNKTRKFSNGSDFGVQTSILQEYNKPIKKNNISTFIPLQSQMKKNQINLSRKRKNSQYEENISEMWATIINDYLNNEEALTTKFKHRTEHLLKKCVPYQLRSTVWPMVFQNPLGLTLQFYMQLLQNRAKGWVDNTVTIQIQKDLNRSFSTKGQQFQNKNKLIDQVQQVLELLHLYRPDVSYVQGMTYPAIVLITVVGKMKAFCILANQIIGIPFFKRLYTFEGKYPSIYCRTFDYLLKDINSSVYEILQRKHLSSEIFLIEWFYTFFSRVLNFQTTLKIWDHMAYFGQITIFKLAVTVIELVSTYLLDATYQGALGLIKQFSSYIDEKKLIQAFTNSKVTEDRYKKAFKKAFKSFQS